ncbi:hypothetical protein GCM10009753_70450 [Streptantibioticus ferralitis]
MSGQVGHGCRLFLGEGWQLPSSVVRAMTVVVLGVGVEDLPGVGLVPDEEMVRLDSV